MRLLSAPFVLAQSDGTAEEVEDALEDILKNGPSNLSEALDIIVAKFTSLWTGLVASLPIILIGVLVFLVIYTAAKLITRGVGRGLDKAGTDPVVGRLLTRVLKAILTLFALLFALLTMGVAVGNVITFLAVLGFAVGLAVQGILENFVAGVILLLRKPFRAGDQIISGDFEGVVEDIDFRVTTLTAYDGTVQLIPNGQVYDNPLVNLTARGERRSAVSVGVDYRDDHNAAREVIRAALDGLEGVMADPAPDVLLTELGDSSVNFTVRYWTKPDIASVVKAQDVVLAAVKTAIDEAGMTIPWPIRTLIVDGPVAVEGTQP